MFVFVNERSYCALVKQMLDKSILTKWVGFNSVCILLCWKLSLKNFSSGILHYVLATGNEAPDSIKLSEGFPVMGKQPLCVSLSTVGDLDGFWYTNTHLFYISWRSAQQLSLKLIEGKGEFYGYDASLVELLTVLLDDR